jgi:3'-phosphoadenosine 5'-phosphosulfate sulfotransferase (PAPS reductase)/FAD synthetase
MNDIYFECGFPIGTKEQAKAVEELQPFIKRKENIVTTYKRLIGANYLGLNNKRGTRYKLSMWAYEMIARGVPITSKCCNILKKSIIPKNSYQLVGELAEESELRERNFIRYGAIKGTKSTPIIHFTKSDIWEYIHNNNLSYSAIYDKGATRTGCFNCLMGSYGEIKKGQGNRLKSQWEIYYPKQYAYHMKQTHKDGMSFGEAVEIWEQVVKKPDYCLAYSKKLELLKKLEGALLEQGLEYNDEFLQDEIRDTQVKIKKYLKDRRLF